MEKEKFQPEQCIFNNRDILKALEKKEVPENLTDRLSYFVDDRDEITLEVYTDKETGDKFKFGKIPRFYKTRYMIVDTKVGEYKCLYCPDYWNLDSFFFNGKETSETMFFKILEQQIPLSDSED